MYEFDRDTAVAAVEPNRWQGRVSPDWFFRVAPNGGYMVAMAARAMGEAFSLGEFTHADPVSVTASFIAPASAGAVEIEVTPLRRGKRFSQGIATLKQGDQPCVQLMATYADFDSLRGAHCDEFVAVKIPSPQACEPLQPDEFPFRQRVETYLAPEDFQYFPGGGKGQMEHRGWVRFTDGRPADLLALLLFADAFPRAMVMRSGVVGWIPTLDLTVQCLARPAPGLIATRFNSRLLSSGILEEQGELWDSKGKLVAVCRQSAVPRVPEEHLALLD